MLLLEKVYLYKKFVSITYTSKKTGFTVTTDKSRFYMLNQMLCTYTHYWLCTYKRLKLYVAQKKVGVQERCSLMQVDLDQTLARLSLSQLEIAAFCQRWQVSEFALFGSVLREDFRPDSDVDVLVELQPTALKGLSQWLAMQDELEALFERKVDLVSKRAIQESHNWIRQRNILSTAQVIYGS